MVTQAVGELICRNAIFKYGNFRDIRLNVRNKRNMLMHYLLSRLILIIVTYLEGILVRTR